MTDVLALTTCSTCRAAAPTPPPLTWSPAIEEGHRIWTCPECARENIRSIEGRIAQAWW